MFRLLSGVVLIAVSCSLVVPYTAAMLCQLLYSHQPLKPATLLRSLRPRRVYALSLVIVQKLVLTARYAPLYLYWRQYYITADPSVMVKNLVYGRNNCCLDLHLPTSHRLTTAASKPTEKPVVMFVYGGAWSSGNKNMYGALCAQLARQLDVLICCPNYSHYPQGCVDDMIQDIVDCIQWIFDNIHSYGGDKNKIMLIGHSAGAHLCTMALLELLQEQRRYGGNFSPDVSAAAGMLFHESHYGKFVSDPGSLKKDPLEDSSGSSESFAVVSENGNGNGENQPTRRNNSTTVVSQVDSSLQESAATPKPVTERLEFVEKQSGQDGVKDRDDNLSLLQHSGRESVEREDDSGDEEDDNDSVVTVRPKDIERHATFTDLASSIKAFVGLAGVYHIGDHYKHESMRGVENMSKMCPAMYGPEHFERFSPVSILPLLDPPVSLPPMVLVHGVADYVVPVSSSQKMADGLACVSANVSLHLIPDCDHYDICFDLMKPSRRFYSPVMTVLLDTAKSAFG